MIDRGDIRQAIDRYRLISGLHCQALVMVSSGIRPTFVCKIQRAERSRLMYEQSHRDYLAPDICIIVCLSWAVNHYRDNAITYKAGATKMPENEAGERGNY